MKFHPAADVFPYMDDKRYDELVASIKEHGLIEPITLCDGMVLDGRNRFKACLDAGITPRYREHTGNPWEYAWVLNGERRDLLSEQRAHIWIEINKHSEAWQAEEQRIKDEANAKRAEAVKEQPRNENGTMAPKPVSEQNVHTPDRAYPGREAKAKASKTNAGAIARAETLRRKRPDLAEKVRLGEMKSAEAHRIMKRDEISKRNESIDVSEKYRVVYADPPWKYGNTMPDYFVEQGDHYPLMTLNEICALPVKEICENNSVLFLWVTSPILEDSFKVINAWGFKYKSSFVWDKIKHNMGHYNSVRHELLLICVKGSCQPDVRKLFDSVQSIERTEHSKKPNEFREIIDTIYPNGKRVELFAREAAPGWETWGNQS